MAKTLKTREDVAALRLEASTSEREFGTDYMVRLYNKARRWELAIEKREAAEVKPPFDTLGFIMDYESGNATEEQVIEGFQHLIDNGMAWTLQGSYGRMAMALINAGHCTRT